MIVLGVAFGWLLIGVVLTLMLKLVDHGELRSLTYAPLVTIVIWPMILVMGTIVLVGHYAEIINDKLYDALNNRK